MEGITLLYKMLLKEILRGHKDAVAVLIHGSAVDGNLKDYSDIDFNVFVSGKPKSPIENKVIRWENKQILVNLNIENFKTALDSISNEKNAGMILINLTSYKKVRVLYDRNGFVHKLRSLINSKEKEIRKRQAERLPVNFNLLVDGFFRLRRSYTKKDTLSVFRATEYITNNSVRILQFFNKIDANNLYVPHYLNNYGAVLNLKNTPPHFKKDFKVCMRFTKKSDIHTVYSSATRMAKEITCFLGKQNLKSVKNQQFLTLLNQAKDLLINNKG